MSTLLVIGNKNYSSWSLRPWLAMKQAGLDFTEIRIPLDTPETHDRILQYSPAGRVPVLIHNDLTIWDSLAIGEYLAEQFPGHWWPEESAARAIARSVSAEMHSGFSNLRQQMPMDCRARLPRQGRAPGVQTDIDRVVEIWRTCRQQFGAGGDFLFGQFTFADAMYAPVVSRFVTYEVELDKIARAYTDAIWSLPAMQEWLEAAATEPEYLAESKL
ncbi:MAG: glutathione S-transferase family protein [Leptolyngbyaceae cyanobacterium RM1_406_9]|nr:glutathione S-transferase family protein [Leptolyngbyaceae cyanobacterium SM1_4_3]NJN90125.1 glutathione S-transferase family protein [Leptolyngbyaceae cyanobacterium SL_5_14]NJO73153.1 glutathione S-transferase family protein [Leptolyngbyaceae cyanobacterium RM1_406_9]